MTSPENLLILPLPEVFRDDVFRIETRRLWLRWPTVGDAARLHEIAVDETAARGATALPHPLLAGDAIARIAAARGGNEAGSGLVLALSSKAQLSSRTGDMIGIVSLDVTRGGAMSLCFVLDVRHQGCGLMTEAVRGLVDAVFAFGAHRAIRGPAGLTNHAARRVLEKSGFQAACKDIHEGAVRLELTRLQWQRRAPLRAELGLDADGVAGPRCEPVCGCAG